MHSAKAGQDFWGLCGRFIDSTGALAPDIDVRIADDSGGTVVHTQTDSKTAFIFLSLAKGKHRLKTTTVRG